LSVAWRPDPFVPEPAVSAMEFLARFRVALGWVFAPLILILANPSQESIVVGTIVALIGEAVRIWAAGHLNKSREVTSSGPYRYFAHPLYVGSSVMGAGLAIASANPIAAALIVLYLFVTLRAAIRNEEAFLRRTFGDRYDRYRRDGVVSWNTEVSAVAVERRFSIGQAVANREHRALAGLFTAMLLLVLKATYNGAFWRAAGP
jgi:protein-S-isoprenylcysteine O-methyltransferase Ste14